MSPRSARLILFLSALAAPAPITAWAQPTNPEQRHRALLDIIAEHADRICSTVRAEGSTQSAKVNGQISAEASGLARAVAKLRGSTGGAVESSVYEGVRQQDLATALKDVSECRLRVSENLVKVMLAPGGSAPLPLAPRPERRAAPSGESAAVASRTLQPVAAPSRPGWTRDRQSGCHTWNPSPMPDETVRWSGSCSDAKAVGFGVADWASPAAASEWIGNIIVRIAGTAVAGRFEGEVEETYDVGRRTRTQWANGQPTAGHQTTIFTDGFQVAGYLQPNVGLVGDAVITGPDFRYEGPVDQELRPHGVGTASWNGGSAFRATWTNGCAVTQGQLFWVRQDASACQRLR